MIIDPASAPPATIYSAMTRAIVPRPIAWVSTMSTAGKLNLAPFSYFNGVGSVPAALSISVVNKPDGTEKDTIRNIEAIGEFVVNVVPFAVAEQMLQTAGDFDYEESEFEIAGVTPRSSNCVAVPAVAQSPIQFECKQLQIVRIGEGPLAANLVVGQILAIVVDDNVLDVNGEIDPSLVDSIGRMGGKNYCRTKESFSIATAGN